MTAESSVVTYGATATLAATGDVPARAPLVAAAAAHVNTDQAVEEMLGAAPPIEIANPTDVIPGTAKWLLDVLFCDENEGEECLDLVKMMMDAAGGAACLLLENTATVTSTAISSLESITGITPGPDPQTLDDGCRGPPVKSQANPKDTSNQVDQPAETPETTGPWGSASGEATGYGTSSTVTPPTSAAGTLWLVAALAALALALVAGSVVVARRR